MSRLSRISGNANIKESFKLAASGMATVCLAIAAFIVTLWIIITIVRLIAGLG